ncbi:MAG: sigma 54-dependent Fis family transcriptional regulator [Labilithrix sp.]|nr:sigma 54-dependent Fis family transcriptional regulator [Labilithrix sp.]MCW5815138.1 sigma 54-dependent Fis family transcriptional regulator [Labilithrix sp.]
MKHLSDFETNALTDVPTKTIRVKSAHVSVTNGPDAGRSARIDRPSFLIGTGPTADLRLSDDTVSREHLRFTLQEDGIHVRDVGSRNGTWLGTVRMNDVVVAQSTSFLAGSTTIALDVEAAVDLPISATSQFGGAIGESTAMRHLFALLERAAQTEVSVLIEGESGVGKDVLANGIHAASARADGPFVALDCGAIPHNLIESELFGHERGAFTGADRSREGAFVQAHGGTLFLDEIGELPLEMQPKLLRALEAREVRPLGGRGTRSVDVRIVAATNRNLSEAANANEFRRDLFYRLAVLRVGVPPLRERKEDVLPLAYAFLSRIPGFEDTRLSPDLEAMLLSYPWPGNVRELRNVIQRYTVLGPNAAGLFGEPGEARAGGASGDDLAHLPYLEAKAVAIERFERAYLPAVLARAGNVVVRAAELAGVRRGSFHRMLHRIRSPHGADE